MSAAPRIALIAGELSGDLLGGAIVQALRRRLPGVHCYGMAGPRMIEAGCEAIESIDALSVMGLAEVLPKLPAIFALRARLIERLLADRPAVVVGIDAPDFNLGLERRLRERGLRTVHVVSPTVWAWRQGRVRTIARSVDELLCLFPFEPAFYAGHGLPARFIGHPLADQLDASTPPAQARATLGLAGPGPLLAVLPGSRGGELRHLAAPFAGAVARLQAQLPDLQVLSPVAKPGLRGALEAAIREHAPQARWQLIEGRSREVMQAADAVLLASGTATLECLLLGRPMVVAYRTAALTAWLMLKAGLLKTRYVSLPNILAGAAVVPERLQAAATPARLADDLLPLLTDPAAARAQTEVFDRLRPTLRHQAAERAAEAIAQQLG
ncbi:MAG TPA: lipid-A-disaccharide synthase [Nevskiaceae bacterium]|nr:lipid-A-disaccharide synthase [Nevskiaceae bacterium]